MNGGDVLQVDDEMDRIYEDTEAAALFGEVFNPLDDTYDIERDGDRFLACLDRLMRLGYSEETARSFLNDNLSECDSDQDDWDGPE